MAHHRPSGYRPVPYRSASFIQAPAGPGRRTAHRRRRLLSSAAARPGLAGASGWRSSGGRSPATTERLGEIPMAVARQGLVVGAPTCCPAPWLDPSTLRRHLLPGKEIENCFPGCYGEVRKETLSTSCARLGGADPPPRRRS